MSEFKFTAGEIHRRKIFSAHARYDGKHGYSGLKSRPGLETVNK